MNKHRKLGKTGENLAIQFLIQKKINIIDTNWRWQKAEIDIIAENRGIIIFVEVKTRSRETFGMPFEFVSAKKQALMQSAAEAFLEQNDLENEIRFDIISIIYNSNFKKIDHIVDAF